MQSFVCRQFFKTEKEEEKNFIYIYIQKTEKTFTIKRGKHAKEEKKINLHIFKDMVTNDTLLHYFYLKEI